METVTETSAHCN